MGQGYTLDGSSNRESNSKKEPKLVIDKKLWEEEEVVVELWGHLLP